MDKTVFKILNVELCFIILKALKHRLPQNGLLLIQNHFYLKLYFQPKCG